MSEIKNNYMNSLLARNLAMSEYHCNTSIRQFNFTLFEYFNFIIINYNLIGINFQNLSLANSLISVNQIQKPSYSSLLKN